MQNGRSKFNGDSIRLLPQTLEKLTYIKMNYRVAHPDIKAEANMFDSDAEDPVDYDFEPSESDDDIF